MDKLMALNQELIFNPWFRVYDGRKREERDGSMAVYHVFKSKREVEVPDEMVRFFEEHYHAVDDRKLSYLAYVEDATEEDDKADLERAILRGMVEELELYVDAESLHEIARRCGVEDF